MFRAHDHAPAMSHTAHLRVRQVVDAQVTNLTFMTENVSLKLTAQARIDSVRMVWCGFHAVNASHVLDLVSEIVIVHLHVTALEDVPAL